MKDRRRELETHQVKAEGNGVRKGTQKSETASYLHKCRVTETDVKKRIGKREEFEK